MKYQNENTKEIKEYRDIKSENKNVSFPKEGAEIILGTWRFIQPTSKPAHDTDTHYVEEIAPIDYAQTWQVIERDQADKDKVKADKDKKTLEVDWDQYKQDEEAAKKQAWIDAGMPKYK